MASHDDAVDVLVIGAGASGAAFSWSLSRAGIKVLCLDQGGWVDSAAYPAAHDEWEHQRQGEWSPDPNVRRLAVDYPVNSDDSPIAPLMYNAVGGSTIHWSAHFPRLKPSDFKVRTLDGVAADWPLSYAQLEPYFDPNDRMMGVAGVTGDPSYPPKSPRQTPPIPLGRLGETMVAGFEKLGWHWWPSDTAIITRAYAGRRACNNCGPCDLGCPVGAKASTDITYWPQALALGARLQTHARVREITLDARGRADGVRCYDAAGQMREQKARAVVLAGNGIGTARLLLNSRSGRFPDGLANSSGLVGRNLMFHPYAIVQGLFDEPLEGYQGPNGCTIHSQEFYETDTSRGFVRGYSFQVGRGLTPAATALGGSTLDRVPWGAEHRRAFNERCDRISTIAVIGEDLPEEQNRVTLDSLLTDGDGIPAPKVTYTLSENSRRLLDHGVARARGLRRRGRPRNLLHAAAAARRLAPDGHGAHGHGPGDLGGGRGGPLPRRAQPVHHRRQRDGHRRRREPDLDHSGGGALHRRPAGREGEAAMTTAETAAARRALIAAVLNCLIPPGEGFPGAGEVATGHIERVLGHAEPSAALLSDALDAIAQAAGEQGVAGFASLAAAERVALLRVVEAARPECFDALLSHTYGGYYSQPAVLRLLGRDAHPPQPQGYRLEPLDLRLIEGVGRRAPFWRQA